MAIIGFNRAAKKEDNALLPVSAYYEWIFSDSNAVIAAKVFNSFNIQQTNLRH
jgi:hypothetical protein